MPSKALGTIIAKNGLNLPIMNLARGIIRPVLSLMLAVLVFNTSICLAEIDAMKRLKPNKQLVEYLINIAGLQDTEEDPVPVIEIDLFYNQGHSNQLNSPYNLLEKGRFHEHFGLVYHPQETVTPPPEV